MSSVKEFVIDGATQLILPPCPRPRGPQSDFEGRPTYLCLSLSIYVSLSLYIYMYIIYTQIYTYV